MGAVETVLFTIEAVKGRELGRTAIQKLIYFQSIINGAPIDYKPYYYGPYSDDVTNAIQTLSSLDFVKENVDRIVHQGDNSSIWTRYRYSLSDDGKKVVEMLKAQKRPQYEKVRSLVEKCEEITNLDQQTLSCAAKVHVIQKKEKKQMTKDEIRERAKQFGWNLSTDQIDNAIKVLEKLQLI